jgi:hypothetical protein
MRTRYKRFRYKEGGNSFSLRPSWLADAASSPYTYTFDYADITYAARLRFVPTRNRHDSELSLVPEFPQRRTPQKGMG